MLLLYVFGLLLITLVFDRNDELQSLKELAPTSTQERLMKQRFLYKVTDCAKFDISSNKSHPNLLDIC